MEYGECGKFDLKIDHSRLVRYPTADFQRLKYVLLSVMQISMHRSAKYACHCE